MSQDPDPTGRRRPSPIDFLGLDNDALRTESEGGNDLEKSAQTQGQAEEVQAQVQTQAHASSDAVLPSTPFPAVVVHGYSALKSTEMSVSVGMQLNVMDVESSAHWCFAVYVGGCAMEDGLVREGWIPKSSVKPWAEATKTTAKVAESYVAVSDGSLSVDKGKSVVVLHESADPGSTWIFALSGPQFPCRGGWIPVSSISPQQINSEDNARRTGTRSRSGSRTLLAPISQSHASASDSTSGGAGSSKKFIDMRSRQFEALVSPIHGRNWNPRNPDLALAHRLQEEELKTAGVSPTQLAKIMAWKKHPVSAASASASSPPPRTSSSFATNSKPPAYPPPGPPAQQRTPECIVCMDKPIQCALYPCWHTCLCLKCAEKLQECPQCKVKIQHRQKVYL